MSDKPLVLVTGASGYIAMHCVLQLLEQGYRVRGTLRSLDKESRLRSIFAEYVDADERLEFVAANLLEDAGWDEAMHRCTYVLHVASPLPGGDVRDEASFIRPAVEGTRRVLQAAHAANVERVVQTSSVAAIIDTTQSRESKVWSEDDWADANKDIPPYAKSKTLAERAAWEFVEAHPELELAAINPVFVIGPVFDDRFSPSVDIVLKLLRKDFPGVARLGFSLVDVRDVAAAHVTAMTHPDAPGKRFICSTDFLWMKEIAEILNENLTTHNVPTMPLPDFLVRFIALFDRSLGEVTLLLGKKTDYANERLKTVLGWQPRPVKDSVLDTAHSLIEKKIV